MRHPAFHVSAEFVGSVSSVTGFLRQCGYGKFLSHRCFKLDRRGATSYTTRVWVRRCVLANERPGLHRRMGSSPEKEGSPMAELWLPIVKPHIIRLYKCHVF